MKTKAMIGCHITPLPPLLVVFHAVGDVITLADKSVTFNYTKYDGTSQSRTVTYAGTKVEVTAVNGSGGVTGHKFIDYGLTNGFDSLQIIWDRYWDTDKGTLVSLMTHGQTHSPKREQMVLQPALEQDLRFKLKQLGAVKF